MTRLTCRFGLLLAASVLLAAGCSEPESPPADSGTSGGGAVDKTPDEGSTPPAGGSDARPKVPGTPEAAIMALAQGFKENKPQAFWEFLPGSYQNDVNGLVHDFAERMDADLWNRTFKIVQRIVKILETKKEFILENPMLKQNERVDVEGIAANWDAMAGLLSTLVNSEVSDLDKLKEIEIGAFLAQTGGSMMDQLSALSAMTPDDRLATFKQDLSVLKANVVKSEGDTATVKLEMAGELAKTKEVELVRVEGKWIHKTMADEWDASIAKARENLAKITPESLAKKKEQTLKQLDGFDQFLGKLEEAKTAEEFNMALMPMTAMIMALNNMGGIMPDLEATGSDTVTIVIQTEIDDKTDEALADTLLALTDNPDLGLALSDVAEGKTKFEVSPVKDVDAFAKKIDFGKVVRIDAEKRQITVELKKSENEPPKKKPE